MALGRSVRILVPPSIAASLSASRPEAAPRRHAAFALLCGVLALSSAPAIASATAKDLDSLFSRLRPPAGRALSPPRAIGGATASLAHGLDHHSYCQPGRHAIHPVGSRAAWTFARACARSPTFRALLAELTSHSGLEIEIEVVPASHAALEVPSLRGQTRWLARGPTVFRGDGCTTHVGRISILVVLSMDEAEILGHELYHALELAVWGEARRIPGHRISGGRRLLVETGEARAIQRLIRSELTARNQLSR